MAIFFSCFYAKAAKIRVAARGLGDGRVTRRAAGGIMRIRSARRTGMELFAATRKVRRSTRTSVVCIYHLLRQLRRSSFFCPYFYSVNNFLYNCTRCLQTSLFSILFEKLEEEAAANQKDRLLEYRKIA